MGLGWWLVKMLFGRKSIGRWFTCAIVVVFIILFVFGLIEVV